MNFLNRGRKKCIKPIDVGMSNATYTDEFINLIDETSIYAVVSTKGAIKELELSIKLTKDIESSGSERTLIISGSKFWGTVLSEELIKIHHVTFQDDEFDILTVSELINAASSYQLVLIHIPWSYHVESIEQCLRACEVWQFDNVILSQLAGSAPGPYLVRDSLEPICQSIYVPAPIRNSEWYIEPLRQYKYMLENLSTSPECYRFSLFDDVCGDNSGNFKEVTYEKLLNFFHSNQCEESNDLYEILCKETGSLGAVKEIKTEWLHLIF